MSEKTIKNRIVNLLLSLYVIDRVNQVAEMEDNLKHQKLVFLSQKLLNESKRRGFRYTFLRWHKGPFSINVNEDLALLQNNNFINWGQNKITLTRDGSELLESSKEIFENNKDFLRYIDRVIEENSHLSPDEIKKRVYDIRVWVPKIRKVMRIEEVLPKQLLMYELSERKARYSFQIDDEWLETLEVIFDREAMDLLKKTENDVKMGNYQVLNAL